MLVLPLLLPLVEKLVQGYGPFPFGLPLDNRMHLCKISGLQTAVCLHLARMLMAQSSPFQLVDFRCVDKFIGMSQWKWKLHRHLYFSIETFTILYNQLSCSIDSEEGKPLPSPTEDNCPTETMNKDSKVFFTQG